MRIVYATSLPIRFASFTKPTSESPALLRRHGVAGVSRFVFVSSAGVLGDRSPTEGFTDTSPAAPHDEYTRSKLAGEQMLAAGFGALLEVVVCAADGLRARCAWKFRPHPEGGANGIPLPLGGLRAPRSLISVRNLCDVMLRAATCNSVEARPMPVRTGKLQCGGVGGSDCRGRRPPEPGIRRASTVAGCRTKIGRAGT